MDLQGVLSEHAASTGTLLQTVEVGDSVPTFAAPSTALWLILVPTTKGVTACIGR